MKPLHLLSIGALALVGAAWAAPTVPMGRSDGAGAELFEREVRPLLVARCQSCHGDAQAQGGLRMRDRSQLLRGGGRGPAIVPGRPDESLLVRAIERRGELRMPPDAPLSDREVASVRRWITLGAPWGAPAGTNRSADIHPSSFRLHPSNHWAFLPVRRPSLPVVRDAAWVRTPVDRFVLARLEEEHRKPAPPADRRTLIRRVTFDLTGLPPTPEEVDAFLRDAAPGAYERVVDRLLASPAYGQRYARHWLDLVRYADYHDGDPKSRTASCEPLMAWRYRDWVVDSFNRDLPFDRFITHQIAGDLLPAPDGGEIYPDGLVATTFLSNGSWDRGDADKEKMVSDMVDDQIDTIGKAFLGLNLGCARCHDHKFDPVTQKDYYALAGIFYSTHILKELGAKGAEYTLNRVPLVPREYLSRREKQLAEIAKVNGSLGAPDTRKPKQSADDPGRLELVHERERLERELLPEPAVAEAAQESGTPGGLFPRIQDVPIHIRGSYTHLGEVVPRRMPAFLAGAAQPPITKGSGRRELAAWIASNKNPLTARVIVNRAWQWHFGNGLVGTPNNFGVRGEAPTDPALLDWLASVFAAASGDSELQGDVGTKSSLSAFQETRGRELRPAGPTGTQRTEASANRSAPSPSGPRPLYPGLAWSLKKLHRMIVLSAAYQQRRPPHRLEAEAIRDSMLAVTGRLDPARGGPATADLSTPRRSLYVQTARWDRGTFALLFDAANPDASEERRTVSTVAPQALFLLNHEFTLDQARILEDRLTREVPTDERARLDRAYLLLYARRPTEEEVRVDLAFLSRDGARGPGTAWLDLVHVLLCSNEFVYVD